MSSDWLIAFKTRSGDAEWRRHPLQQNVLSGASIFFIHDTSTNIVVLRHSLQDGNNLRCAGNMSDASNNRGCCSARGPIKPPLEWFLRFGKGLRGLRLSPWSHVTLSGSIDPVFRDGFDADACPRAPASQRCWLLQPHLNPFAFRASVRGCFRLALKGAGSAIRCAAGCFEAHTRGHLSRGHVEAERPHDDADARPL